MFAAAISMAAVGGVPVLVAAPSGAQAVPVPQVRPSQSPTATDQIIVRFAGQPDAGAVPDPAGGSAQVRRELGDGSWVVKLDDRYAPADAAAIAAAYARQPGVKYAEPDTRQFATVVPNDTRYPDQWDLQPVTPNTSYGANLPAAWDITTGSASQVVAVVDTGYLNHADLAGRFVPGYDMVSDAQIGNDGDGRDANALDPGDWITSAENSSGFFAGCGVSNSSWHGTHVAGTIGAASNNATGVAGINWNAKILPVRVLGKCGGYSSDIADGMRWAAGLTVSGVPANPNPAKVINLSLGGSGACSTTYQNAVNAVTAAGSMLVIAAGNSNSDAANFQPGNCAGVVTVAATGRAGNRATYSNYGSTVEIAAPGGNLSGGLDTGILSTLNTGTTSPVADAYVAYQGTSMAAPHVAGVASLVWAAQPSLTAAQVTTFLQISATPFKAGSTCTTAICGPGILNAGAAVAAATSPPSSLSGTVRDGNGAAIKGAQVRVPGNAVAVTDASGNYSLPTVVAGSYTVQADGACRAPASQSVSISGPTVLDFTLGISGGCYVDPAAWDATSTVLALSGDDASLAVALPFPYAHAGASYTTANVSTNGVVNFLAPDTTYSNTAIPNAAAPNAALYGFWDDLIVDGSSSVLADTFGSAPNRRFVIEWRNVALLADTTKRLSFQIVLYESTAQRVRLQYKDIADGTAEAGTSATVGTENAAGNGGTQVLYNNGLLFDGLSVRPK
ncbi:MAG: S8 family serine peptidase [Acidimicrobiales bacterium]